MDSRASIYDMIETVLRSLSVDILPLIADPAAAGKLRSCMAILTYAEDRVEQERSTLIADAAAMRTLLAEAARGSASSFVPDPLDAIPPRSAEVSTRQLVAEDTSYRLAVSALIEQLASGDGPVRPLLRETLAGMQARQYAMLRRMEAVPAI